MVQEVPVDRNLTTLDGERGHAEPVSIGMAGRLAGAHACEGIRCR